MVVINGHMLALVRIRWILPDAAQINAEITSTNLIVRTEVILCSLRRLRLGEIAVVDTILKVVDFLCRELLQEVPLYCIKMCVHII